ncbi:MAG: GspE/PulE family protein [Candidatus Shapirobacteria bacterium]|jgi:type IV pilus assembly protein PilB
MFVVRNHDLYRRLKELEVIPAAKLEESFQMAESDNRFLGDILYERDLISDENLGKLLSDLTGVPLVRLSENQIPKDILTLIPQVYAKKQLVIAFAKDKSGLHLALVNPKDTQIPEFIEKKTGIPVIVHLATVKDLKDAINLYSQDVGQAFEDIINDHISQAKNRTATDPPIIKIVDTILNYAYQNKSSDIHIEPQNDTSLVRFRIDGILHDIVTLPRDVHQNIVTRIKVLANLRTDEHQAAQDGKFQFPTEDENLDLRVSIVPLTDGEKIVMRLLSEKSRQFSLASLGFSASDLEKVTAAYQKPYGMLLSTGPTGSGKTTSMYSVLKLLNHREVNIMTIEDPVEYEMEGVNQIQVNSKTNLTFAKGLRSIVRQDPDIILVGEIRDEETAEIATNSAMTGHLVLSTLHTNDAATAIPRLSDMGVEPFLIASSVNCIIAQRLVRKICTKCRISDNITLDKLKKYGWSLSAIKKHFGPKGPYRIYSGKGCPVCHHTGYTGRVGIFEVLVISEPVRNTIIASATASTLQEVAIKNGMTTMLEDGLAKIKQGITTVEEILRATKS